jgi:hypothetical protein
MARAPALSEDEIQIALMAHIRRRGAPGLVAWHTPNGGARSKAAAARFKAMGVRAGVPDMAYALPGARMVFHELKAEGGRLSLAQNDLHERLRAHGFDVLVTVGLDAAIAALEGAGVIVAQKGRAA